MPTITNHRHKIKKPTTLSAGGSRGIEILCFGI